MASIGKMIEQLDGLRDTKYISSGLQTLDQAGIEQRNLLVFQIGSGRTARLLAMGTLLNREILMNQGYVASRLSATELFSLAFYFLRLGSSTIWKRSIRSLGIQGRQLCIFFRCHQKKRKL